VSVWRVVDCAPVFALGRQGAFVLACVHIVLVYAGKASVGRKLSSAFGVYTGEIIDRARRCEVRCLYEGAEMLETVGEQPRDTGEREL
jgi:hypothetical protein